MHSQPGKAIVRTVTVAAVLSIACSQAAELTGRVVGVHDGDTVTVLDARHTQHKIRLAGIDAPELKQPFGTRSRQNLAGMVYRQTVYVNWDKRDRYRRLVGKVQYQRPCAPGAMCTQALTDANLAQIAAGMAWHYKQYEREQSPEDRTAYAASEVDARGRAVGLWSHPSPVPPWEWRGSRGETLRSHVLLVPHHGSRTSSSPEFLAAVRPRYAIVSAGYRNRFGHPRPDVVERYREAGSRLYRTDRDGALTVTIKEESIAVHAFRARHRRYWHAPYRGPVEEDAEAPES